MHNINSMFQSLVEFVRSHFLWGNRKRNDYLLYNIDNIAVYYIRLGNVYNQSNILSFENCRNHIGHFYLITFYSND